jgi:XTP/dITP diphosphohydrolase
MSGASILFGSTNEGKLLEVRAAAARKQWSVLSLSDIDSPNGPCPEVVEGENTYEGNASKKAVVYSKWAGRRCIADDTGLEILAFGRLPGVYTARYGINRLLQELMPGMKHAARFVCCMSYAEPCGRTVSVTAELPGYFYFQSRKVETTGSLPFSRHFFPYGEKEPQALVHLVSHGGYRSHRVRALEGLLRILS